MDTGLRREVKKKLLATNVFKTQKHSVRIGLSWYGWSFYEHFNRQFNYAVFLYSKSGYVFE